MTIGNLAVGQLDRVVGELVVVLIRLDAHERQCQQDGAGMEKLEPAKLAHLARGPGHHGRDTRSDEDHGVRRPHRNIEPPMGPITFHRSHAQQDIRREERAEQHDFRGQKEPDADFGVVKAGVLPRLDDVGENFRGHG